MVGDGQRFAGNQFAMPHENFINLGAWLVEELHNIVRIHWDINSWFGNLRSHLENKMVVQGQGGPTDKPQVCSIIFFA
jgi:hypothetical protein